MLLRRIQTQSSRCKTQRSANRGTMWRLWPETWEVCKKKFLIFFFCKIFFRMGISCSCGHYCFRVVGLFWRQRTLSRMSGWSSQVINQTICFCVVSKERSDTWRREVFRFRKTISLSCSQFRQTRFFVFSWRFDFSEKGEGFQWDSKSWRRIQRLFSLSRLWNELCGETCMAQLRDFMFFFLMFSTFRSQRNDGRASGVVQVCASQRRRSNRQSASRNLSLDGDGSRNAAWIWRILWFEALQGRSYQHQSSNLFHRNVQLVQLLLSNSQSRLSQQGRCGWGGVLALRQLEESVVRMVLDFASHQRHSQRQRKALQHRTLKMKFF